MTWINQKTILTFAAATMGLFAAVTAAAASIDHQGMIVGFQLCAAALLYYWANA